MLTEIVPGTVWACERPVWFSGVRLRARTSVVRLKDGRLLIHSPCPPSDELVKELAALGDVAWLVVPNCFHHLGTPAAAAAFPRAKVVGPKSAAAKNAALRLDFSIDDPAFGEAVNELVVLPLEGVPFLDETLLYHRPSKTLFAADAALRADANDHWTWRFAARVTGCYEKLRVPPDVKGEIADKGRATRSLAALASLPVDRLIVAHGEIVEDAALEKLREAWRLVGVS